MQSSASSSGILVNSDVTSKETSMSCDFCVVTFPKVAFLEFLVKHDNYEQQAVV